MTGAVSALTTNCISASMEPEVNGSELSTTRPMCGRVLGVNAAGVLGGNDDGGVDFAGAHVFAGLHLVGVVEGGEGLDVDGDGVEGLAES